MVPEVFVRFILEVSSWVTGCPRSVVFREASPRPHRHDFGSSTVLVVRNSTSGSSGVLFLSRCGIMVQHVVMCRAGGKQGMTFLG